MRYHTSNILLLAMSLLAQPCSAEPSAERGYQWLLEKAYVPPYFDQETFDSSWQAWPEPLRSKAENATPDQRRRMAFSRYGLTTRPGDDSGKPLQFVVDKQGNWSPNCFTCHGGKLLGKPIPGLPNSHYALQTMIDETRATKFQLKKSPAPIDYGALFMPLGTSRGTTNAVIFGVVLGAYRDADLNVKRGVPRQKLIHHDMDAPPWWHFKKKKRLYIDGFAEKGHRGLMQFAMDKSNGPEKFREWEDDYRDIFAYLESLEPPKYPRAIDHKLADQGRIAFNRICADCHGTYGKDESYPHRVVPIDEIATDRARLDALTREHRQSYKTNWFSHYGKEVVVVDPDGYMAPPLDGVWASAPYLHNGSVPTLWHMLHPSKRPVVWRRTEDGYDHEQVGLEIDSFAAMPKPIKSASERREYFNTRRFGKSAAGHLFPDELNDREKHAVLEYLKTL